ncbi:MAG: DUF3486 family protein [Pseudomonadota bacterium]
MPKRPAIEALPAAVKQWLDRALADGNFSGYEALEVELKARGFGIGKSSIHRYGQKLERKLAAIKASTQAATAIAEAAPDDADLRSSAVISLVQTEVFNVLVELQEAEALDDPVERVKLLGRVAKSIAELSRASVNQKKWQVEVRGKLDSRLKHLESQAAPGKAGFDLATLKRVREEVYGIVG